MARLRPYLCFIFVVCLAVQGAAAWPLVKSGDKGPNVVAVQDLLQARGHSLTSDGDFGPITEAAVKAFQLANSLTSDGIVGPLTWPKLIITVRSGSSGRAVHAVQYLLAYKYNRLTSADIDSAFGPVTSAAVISFQASKGLTQDGIVGPLTWDALVSGASSSTVPPSSTNSPTPCSSIEKSRAGVVAAAKETLGIKIVYTQKAARWSGIKNKVCVPSVPPYADCSSFVSWVFWMAYGKGEDFLNRQSWLAGWTGTMTETGQSVALAAAQPGDVVIYFNSSGQSMHAALYIGNSQVITFGENNLSDVRNINWWAENGYYPTYDIRTYSQMV